MGKPGKKAGKGMAPPTKTNRKIPAEKTHLRDQRTVRRLKMYSSKVVHNEKGEIVKGSVLGAADRVQQSMARIAPDRRWFGNTRVIGQEALQSFRDKMSEKYHDPYSVVVKQQKLPLSLLEEPKKSKESSSGQIQWQEKVGEKSRRKRVNLKSESLTELGSQAESRTGVFHEKVITRKKEELHTDMSRNRTLMKKGQSNRIWNELYKVIDSSDVVLYVLDARDPMGTRSPYLENFMKTEKKYKHFVFVLNKCDLVPLWVTARWIQILSKDFPTIAFHASVTHPFGKGNLISLLRQFSRLHNLTHRGSKTTKSSISVGVVGYPNVGKSSLINTLRRKQVCKVAPIPGETKIWQYVALTRTIFLVDCPGIVYDREGNSDIDAVLKGVVRIERLGAADKSEVVDAVLSVVEHDNIVSTYGITEWGSTTEFLEKLSTKRGKLVGGGQPDTDAAARAVLYDWQRGRIPWFRKPAFDSKQEELEASKLNEKQCLERIEMQTNLTLEGDRLVVGDEPLPQEPPKKRKRVEKAAATTKMDEEEALWHKFVSAAKK